MGVRGLETFLHSHPECTKPVNIGELALRYRSKHKKNPKLMIDINSCLRFLNNKKPWVAGSQLKELSFTIEMFLKRLQSIGIDVTAIMDGIVEPGKQANWLTKRKDQINTVNKIFNSLRLNQNSIPQDDFFEMYPTNIKKIIIDTFKECKCQIFQSIYECDLEAAIYAKRNNFFGILAQDSDFVIYDCVEYYFSMKCLDLDTLATICYRSDKLAEILHLSPRQLPLLATTMGNSIVETRSLLTFHRSLFRENEKFSRADAFFKVAGFIKTKIKNNQSLNSQLPGLSKIFFGKTNKTYLLRNSLKSYNMLFPHEENAIDYSDDAQWIEIQRITIELHKSAKLPYIVFSIIFRSKYLHQVYMEDPNKKNNQIWFEMAKKLRRKIYGILLVNKPRGEGKSENVKEIHIDSNMQKKENYVKPIYPKMDVDLPKLWSDMDGIYDEDKWDLFCYSLNIQREILFLEERHLLIPVASLKYLLMERFDIAIWELEAVLASMLLLQYYSIRDLEAIPEFPLDPHGIHLYWFLMRIFDLVATLNSVCGYPLDSDLASPVHFQDGKLFHHKYRQAKENKSFENLCEFRQKEIRSGKKIMSIICE